MALQKTTHSTISMGCDPEFFFKTGDKVIGAEHILPKVGLEAGGYGTSKFVIDGVQAELNPYPNTCRANLANTISQCFKSLKIELDKQKKGVMLDFSRSVEISKEELAKLDEKNQKFGCMPSKSSYPDAGIKLSKVDPLKYLKRSAGGHIHLGCGAGYHKKADDIVQMLDIICGNTCVLIDRDKGNAVRRKLYGRAGEYRLPAHGIEYRTLSNFWLTDYRLMSFAFGLARLAYTLATNYSAEANIKAFKSKVNMDDIQKAINKNNFRLAYQNFKAIEPLLMEVIPDHSDQVGINPKNIEQFHYFVKSVKRYGLKHWFKQDTMEHWCNLPEAHGDGFNIFLNGPVKRAMEAAKKKKKVASTKG